MNIQQKLLEVRKSVPYLKKDSKAHSYEYNSPSQVIGAVRGKMDELGLLLETRIISKEVTQTVVPSPKGDKINYFTELTLEYTWVNADNPEERIVIPWYSQGIDTASERGVGKSLTYSTRYFLLNQLNIATDKDDPDYFEEKAEQNRKPASITEEEEKTLNAKIDEVANLQNIERTAILNSLKVKSIKGISLVQYEAFMAQCDKWIKIIQKQKAGQEQ